MKKTLMGLAGIGILLSGSVAMADLVQINADSILVKGRTYTAAGVPTDGIGQTLDPGVYMGPDGIIDSSTVGSISNILNKTASTFYFQRSPFEELTFVISGSDDVLFNPITNSNTADLYSLGTHIDVYSDLSPNYNVFDGSGAGDGTLVLSLDGHDQIEPTTGGLFDLKELYDYGTGEFVGTALFDVVGGAWASVWNTNTRAFGSDLSFSFSLDPSSSGQYTLSGTANGLGATAPIPEPTTMLLFGAGLIGLIGVSKRKLRK